MTFLLPLAISWVSGIVLLGLDGNRRSARALGLLALVAVLAIDFALCVTFTAPQRVTTGGWPAEVGITLVADRLSLFFATTSAAVGLVVFAHGLPRGERDRGFPGWMLLLQAALHGMFFTNDLFNFYVFFELGVLTSFVLALHGYGRREIRGGVVYVVVNLLGSVLFLLGIALTYRSLGTLDFDALATRGQDAPFGGLLLVGTLLFVALGLKLGVFPFHGWVPALYAQARPAVAAVLAGALSNVGAYGLLRFGSTFLDAPRLEAAPFLVALGVAGALYGSFLAARRRTIAEAAAYAAVAHVGYILIAIGLGATTATLLLVLSGALDKTLIFASLELTRSGRRGLGLVAACSIAGLPVTIGFVAKMLLVRAALDTPIVVAAILTSAAFGLFFVARFSFAARSERTRHLVPPWAPTLLLIAVVGLGAWPAGVVRWAEATTVELAERGP